jgi:hypothetical protein
MKLVRSFSPAGPCLTEGRLVRETARFYIFNEWLGGDRFRDKESRLAKCLPGHYSRAHVEPCSSCRDHARTQYPNGYMD